MARSATDVWLRVLKMLNEQEIRMGREPTKFVVNGAEAFGFGFPEVAMCIEGLDGAELCVNYVFRKLRYAALEEGGAIGRKRIPEPGVNNPQQLRLMKPF